MHIRVTDDEAIPSTSSEEWQSLMPENNQPRDGHTPNDHTPDLPGATDPAGTPARDAAPGGPSGGDDQTRVLGQPHGATGAEASESGDARSSAFDPADPFGPGPQHGASAVPAPAYFPITGDDPAPPARKRRLGRSALLTGAAAVLLALVCGLVGFLIGHGVGTDRHGSRDGDRPGYGQSGDRHGHRPGDRDGTGGPGGQVGPGSSLDEDSATDDAGQSSTPADPTTSIEVPPTTAPTT